MSLKHLMQEYIRARDALRPYRIGNTGDYAEVLVADALSAVRNESGVTTGFDVVCARLGKIEVRSRTLPSDGRGEDRLEIPKKKIGKFMTFAGVLFASDISVIGGFLLPHDDAIELAGKQKYFRIPFSIGRAHVRAIDISDALRASQARL